MADIVNKLWGFCHTLRHDGIDYGDYIEQLTYLLFLKMADEKEIDIPQGYDWKTLKALSSQKLLDHYTDTLRELRKQPGLLGDIFTDAQMRFSNAANLKKLINMIDEEDWAAMDVDVKGQLFEGLLEKTANEGKQGAGQYFTPRELIRSIVRVMKPDPRKSKKFTISDPACGTGGFLVAAFEWLMQTSKGGFNREDNKRIREQTYYGQELVARPRRMAIMNLYLHGITSHIYLGDTLSTPQGGQHQCILTNPPFGNKGAGNVTTRDDITVSTSNKQLNFIQHCISYLKGGGRAAIVLPDNCLFEDKAGEVFKILMEDCNLHTILRLPVGTFTPYAQGVKANVIFFTKGIPTENTWIYDLRTNITNITKKDRPLTSDLFTDFEAAYGDDPNGNSKRKESERFRRFHISEVKKRKYKLDITWIKNETYDDPNNLPEPEELAISAVKELDAVSKDLKSILKLLKK